MACGSCLGGVADLGERVDHEHDAGLRAGHAEMPAGAVVGHEGVGDGARGGDGEELGDVGAGGGEVGLDPGLAALASVRWAQMWRGSGTGLEGGLRRFGIFLTACMGTISLTGTQALGTRVGEEGVRRTDGRFEAKEWVRHLMALRNILTIVFFGG